MSLQYQEKLDVISKIVEMKRIYTVLETSLSHSQSFLVTSGNSGEGKTTVTVGLAIAAAEKNKRVLAVDFNWYSPALHRYFGIDTIDSGDDVFDDINLSDFVKSTGIGNIDILPAVIENGSGQDGSEKNNMMHSFLREMKNDYDMIIIDAAAAFPMNYKMIDPLLISKNVDGVVMVALTNVTPRQSLKKACVAFEAGGANLLGVIANQWQNPI